MNIDYVALGKRIKTCRIKKKFTQAHLAEISEVEPSNISHIERGATKVSLPTLVKIANALEVTLDELLLESLEKSRHVSVKELDEILADCSDKELKAITDVIRTTKDVLRK